MSEKLEQLLVSINDKIEKLMMRVENIERKLNTHSHDTHMVYGPGSYEQNKNPIPSVPSLPVSPTSGLAEQINKMREELMNKYMRDGKPIMPEVPNVPAAPGVGMPGAPGVSVGTGGMGVPNMSGVGMPDLATNMAKGMAETFKKQIPTPEEAENVKIKEEDEEDGK